jgi:hypothetical protein
MTGNRRFLRAAEIAARRGCHLGRSGVDPVQGLPSTKVGGTRLVAVQNSKPSSVSHEPTQEISDEIR